MTQSETPSLTANKFLQKELANIREKYSEHKLRNQEFQQLKIKEAELYYRIQMIKCQFVDDNLDAEDRRILYPDMYPPLTPAQKQQIRNTKELCQQEIEIAKAQNQPCVRRDCIRLATGLKEILPEITPIWKG